MKLKEKAFFYHSNADPPAIVGIVEVIKTSYPDHFAFDKNNRYFDLKSNPKQPRWFMVDIRLVGKLATPLPLDRLRSVKGLERMELLRKGSRLSIQPVREKEWEIIVQLERAGPRRSITMRH